MGFCIFLHRRGFFVHSRVSIIDSVWISYKLSCGLFSRDRSLLR